MELTFHKPRLFALRAGQIPSAQANGLNDLAERIDPQHPPFTAEATKGATRQDLIANLQNGYATVVSVSWGGNKDLLTSGVAHAMTVAGYDPTTKESGVLQSPLT